MDASEDLPNIGDMIDVAVTEVAEEAADSFLNDEEEAAAAANHGKGESNTKVNMEANATEESEKMPVVKGKGTQSSHESSIFTHVKEKGKRIRRAGNYPPRKVPRVEDEVSSAQAPESAREGAPPPPEEPIVRSEEDRIDDSILLDQDQPTFADIPAPVGATKHDEKWNARFDKLLEYKAKHGNTLVPQHSMDDDRLGRWVHYQRVEYWLFQEQGHAKITKERIARLNAIGFEWDPQKTIWNIMFEKLKTFKENIGHCRVPKGYDKDPELANWVRNQRMEESYLRKGKKTRMTQDRYTKLNDLGFKWSVQIPSRSKHKNRDNKSESTPADGTIKQESEGEAAVKLEENNLAVAVQI